MHVLESDVERMNKGKKDPADDRIHDLTQDKMVRNCQRQFTLRLKHVHTPVRVMQAP